MVVDIQGLTGFRSFFVRAIAVILCCGLLLAPMAQAFNDAVAPTCDAVLKQSKIPTPDGFYLCTATALTDQQLQPIAKAQLLTLPKTAFDYGNYHYVGDKVLSGTLSKFDHEGLGMVTLFTAQQPSADNTTPVSRLDDFTKQRHFAIDLNQDIGAASLQPMLNKHGWCSEATLRLTSIKIYVADSEGEAVTLDQFNIIKQGPFQKCQQPPAP